MTPSASDAFDAARVSAARRYDALIGGHDNFAVDRRSAAELEQDLPSIAPAALELRRFLHRCVDHLVADHGIRQFLDIGCGFPRYPNVHEIAQTADSTCRVAYVDPDPMVAAHARALLSSPVPGTLAFLQGDVTDIDAVMHDDTVRGLLDFDQPIGVLLLAVLHFITDDHTVHDALHKIRDAVPPGSYLAISHVTFDPLDPERARRLTAKAHDPRHGPFQARTLNAVTTLFDGWDLIDPGVVPTVQWHPEREPAPRIAAQDAVAYGGIGRLPFRSPARAVMPPASPL